MAKRNEPSDAEVARLQAEADQRQMDERKEIEAATERAQEALRKAQGGK
jgi:hypothetical protein